MGRRIECGSSKFGEVIEASVIVSLLLAIAVAKSNMCYCMQWFLVSGLEGFAIVARSC